MVRPCIYLCPMGVQMKDNPEKESVDISNSITDKKLLFAYWLLYQWHIYRHWLVYQQQVYRSHPISHASIVPSINSSLQFRCFTDKKKCDCNNVNWEKTILQLHSSSWRTKFLTYISYDWQHLIVMDHIFIIKWILVAERLAVESSGTKSPLSEVQGAGSLGAGWLFRPSLQTIALDSLAFTYIKRGFTYTSKDLYLAMPCTG